MKKFNSEMEKENFKDLCREVIPEIRMIEQILKGNDVTSGVSIRIGGEGYLSLDISDSKWRMARYAADGPAKIFYEYSEEIEEHEMERLIRIPNTSWSIGNVIKIAIVCAEMLNKHNKFRDVANSREWNYKLIEWANEFGESWGEKAGKVDYAREIEDFATSKIINYAEEKGVKLY